MSETIMNDAMPQDLKLSIKNADGDTLTVDANYALLVTLPEDYSKRFLSVTPSYVDDTPIADVIASWTSNCEDVASVTATTRGATPNHIVLIRPGTATIHLTLKKGKREQQSASLTIVVAPGVLMFGPDGRYYHMDASVWRAHPLAENKVPQKVTDMIEHGATLFTSGGLPPSEDSFVICYVINLASMSNSLVSGLQHPRLKTKE